MKLQRFDNHTDKLTSYIRFWQADGESEKTSIRTKTALGQLVEDGGFQLIRTIWATAPVPGRTGILLDDIINKMIRKIFRKMKGVSKKDLVQARYAKELSLWKTHITAVKAELVKATEALNVLRAAAFEPTDQPV